MDLTKFMMPTNHESMQGSQMSTPINLKPTHHLSLMEAPHHNIIPMRDASAAGNAAGVPAAYLSDWTINTPIKALTG
jgi:hypothetical protein